MDRPRCRHGPLFSQQLFVCRVSLRVINVAQTLLEKFIVAKTTMFEGEIAAERSDISWDGS